ncbi:MAG: hypothetical protein AAFU64_04315, partial [Bacteroidota bacterium]
MDVYNYPLPTFTGQPQDLSLCDTQSGSITVNAPAGVTFQWQLDDGGGGGFVNIGDGGFYSGTTTNTLMLNSVNTSLDFARYRCVITNPSTTCENTSNESELRIIPVPNNTVNSDVLGGNICEGDPVNITVFSSESGYTYQLREGISLVAGVSPLVGNGSDITFATINPSTTTTYNVWVTTSSINGSACEIELANTVTINVTPTTTPSNAGIDFSVCSETTNLTGNTPTNGTGTWTLVGGAATITSPNDPVTGITGLGLGANTFVWEISNGVCPSTRDTLVITRDLAVTASAGSDQTVCGTSSVLSGNTPVSGSGTWSLVSGLATIVDASDPNSALINIDLGENVLVWTVSNGTCPPSSDTVRITREPSTAVSDAGPNQEICIDNTSLSANTPSSGVGT